MLRKGFQLLVVIVGVGASTLLCAKDIPVDQTSSSAGGSIAIQGTAAQLYEGSLKVGDNFLDLVKGTDVVLPFKDRVTIVSTVPSIDTPVCELQTGELAGSDKVDPQVDLVTISRDLPFAQERFAKDSGLPAKMAFVSDYKTGAFGKKTGLMIKGNEILARSLIVLDRGGVIRYIQVVPELSHLPDIPKAIEEANRLAQKAEY
jgi:thiol peroxidase